MTRDQIVALFERRRAAFDLVFAPPEGAKRAP